MSLLSKNYKAQKIEKLARAAVSRLSDNPSWKNESEFLSEDFYEGDTSFIDSKYAAANANRWRLGYAAKSLVPDDIFCRDYYLAGFLMGGKYVLQNYPEGNAVNQVLDDMRVRAIALDDGSGSGTALFAVIDAIGVSNKDIRVIRHLLADFARENNIKSINVFSTHCHSCIDTQGLWSCSFGEFAKKVKKNKSSQGEFVSGFADKAFMNLLYSQVANAVTEAFKDMKTGSLFFCEKDIADKIHDKRSSERGLKIGDEPSVLTKLSRFTFVPDRSDAKQTIIVNMSGHPCTVGLETYCEDKQALNYAECLSSGKQLSGDYVAYIDEELRSAGYNCIFFNGAIMGTYTSGGNVETEENVSPQRYLRAVAYGREIAQAVLSMKLGESTPVSPYLNIRCEQIAAQVTNPVIIAVGKLGITNNEILKSEHGYKVITEVGYIEIGEKKVLMAPGELCPDLVTGKYSMTAQHSVTGLDFPLPSFDELAGGGLLVFGLANDATGYIMPDTDYALIRYHELLSLGKSFASTLIKSFARLVATQRHSE